VIDGPQKAAGEIRQGSFAAFSPEGRNAVRFLRRTAAATGAIAGAVLVLARRSVFDVPTTLICAVSLAVLFRWKVPEPILIAYAAVAGLLLHKV
jgi:chromate transport protein ChrA